MIMSVPDTRLNGSGCRQVLGAGSSSSAARTEETTMRTSRKLVIGAAAAAVIAGGAGIAAAAGGSGQDSSEGPDVAITGDALRQASDAALAATGGGKVTGTEVSDEESYYEVEVTKTDGSQVDVQLDENFAVVGSSADVEEPGDD
jgi:uncharacterized membrane protein YkoI